MKKTSPKQITKPQTFILESLTLKDEQKNRLDGKYLYDALKIYGKKPVYYYFRTDRELSYFADEFRMSGCRYLHISCHGTNDIFALTFNEITFDRFANIFAGKLDNRRLFISGCNLGNHQLADAVFERNGGMYSVIAPREQIFFTQSVPFWTAFYYRMDAYSSQAMKKEILIEELEQLSKLFEVKMSYFWKNTGTNGIDHKDFPLS